MLAAGQQVTDVLKHLKEEGKLLSDVLEYKGYIGSVHYSDEDEVFTAG